MVLSLAERSYIYKSLASEQIARTDSRKPSQFRPLKATCSFLPNSYGSSRIYTADGIECITSIKAKVIRTNDLSELINVDLEIQGQRDDSNLCLHIATILNKSLLDNFDLSVLKLTDRYYFQIHLDILILSVPEDFQSSSYTLYSILSLTSMGTYLALKSAKLPLLTSETHDTEIEEEPTFSDDWENSTYLIPRNSQKNFKPTLLFVLGVAGKNIVVDPSLEEEQVLEYGICLGFADSKIVPPVQSLTLSTIGGKGINQKIIFKAMEMVKNIGTTVTDALDTISEQELDEFESAF